MVQDALNTYKYEHRSYYPHMKPYDMAIWDKMISEFPDMYDKCEYDVAVGPGPAFDPTVNSDTGGDAYKLYQRKIDVVAHKGGQIDIIELKPNAGPSAVGQVLFYKKLYIEDFKPSVEPKCIVITDRLVAGMAEYCASMNVQLVVV